MTSLCEWQAQIITVYNMRLLVADGRGKFSLRMLLLRLSAWTGAVISIPFFGHST